MRFSQQTLTAATFDHRKLVVEVESKHMLAEEQPWLTAEIDDTATEMNVACDGIAAMRYDNSVSLL